MRLWNLRKEIRQNWHHEAKAAAKLYPIPLGSLVTVGSVLDYPVKYPILLQIIGIGNPSLHRLCVDKKEVKYG